VQALKKKGSSYFQQKSFNVWTELGKNRFSFKHSFSFLLFKQQHMAVKIILAIQLNVFSISSFKLYCVAIRRYFSAIKYMVEKLLFSRLVNVLSPDYPDYSQYLFFLINKFLEKIITVLKQHLFLTDYYKIT